MLPSLITVSLTCGKRRRRRRTGSSALIIQGPAVSKRLLRRQGREVQRSIGTFIVLLLSRLEVCVDFGLIVYVCVKEKWFLDV